MSHLAFFAEAYARKLQIRAYTVFDLVVVAALIRYSVVNEDIDEASPISVER